MISNLLLSDRLSLPYSKLDLKKCFISNKALPLLFMYVVGLTHTNSSFFAKRISSCIGVSTFPGAIEREIISGFSLKTFSNIFFV